MKDKTKEHLEKELDQLYKRHAELEKKEEGRKQSEDILKATNQQLVASEQQLKAANQQLTASEQQLKAANQQLDASNQQLRASEQEISKKEQEWRESFNSLEDVMLLIDKDFNIERINANGLKLLGKPEKDVVGRKCYKIIHAMNTPCEECSMKKSLETGKVEFVERFEKDLCGYFSIKTTPVFDEKGETVRFVDIMRDTTDRKRAEEKLRESAVYLDIIGDALMVLDSEVKVVKVNKSFLELWGYTPDEVIGKPMFELFPKDEIPKHQSEMEFAVKEGSVRMFETIALTKDKEEINVSVSGTVLKDENGNLLNFIALFRDITERKNVEERDRLHAKDMAFLSQTAMAFVELSPDKNIFQFIAEQLQQIVGKEAIIAVADLEENSERFRARALLGVEKSLDYLIKKLGMDPKKMKVPITGEIKDALTSGKLSKFDRGIYELSGQIIPEYVATTIEKLMNLGPAYAMGLRRGVEVYGNICIIFRKGMKLPDAELIEAFVNQASVALERRWAEEELQVSETRLSEAQRVAHMGYWEWNIIADELHWSDESYRIFGFKPREFDATYETFLNAVHPEDREFVQKHIDSAIHNNIEYNIDHRIVLPGSEVRYVHEQGEVSRDTNGNPIRMIGSVIDITERKQAEQLKHFQRNLEVEISKKTTLKETLETILTVIFQLDEFDSGGIYLVDEKSGGVDLVVQQGLPRWFVDTVNHFEPDDTRVQIIMNGEPVYQPVSEFPAAINKELENEGILSLSIIPIWDGEKVMGSLNLASHSHSSITDSNMRIINAIAKSEVGMLLSRAIVKEEKAKLEYQLQQSQKLEAIGQLAGGIAHDFNNILGGISGYSDVLGMKMASDSDCMPYVQKIQKAALKAADLVRQLLMFARKANVSMVRCDIHACINQVVSMLEHTIDKRIEIIMGLCAENSRIIGDQSQIENILLNIGINARDAMPDGGTLTFATETVILDKKAFADHSFKVKKGEYIKITVSDTGIGMDNDIREKVFEPFFTTKEVGKGTGLGLASVYGSVKQHDGYITVESKKGKGTVFFIFFPVLHKENEVLIEEEVVDSIKGTGKILVIDDEEDIRDAMADMLNELGYEVDCCCNGEEAVEYYNKNYKEIDAVILDLIMPKMNGQECFYRLKKINPDAPVIISSGYSEGKETQVLIDNAKAFLEKPFQIKELSKVLAEVLAK